MDTIKIERLIPANTINQNGYKYDEATLAASLDKFMESKGEVRLESMTTDEYNAKAKANSIKDELYPLIGKLVGYDDNYIIVEPLNKAIDIDAIKNFRVNIHAYASDVIEKDGFNLAIIDEVSRIIVGKYDN